MPHPFVNSKLLIRINKDCSEIRHFASRMSGFYGLGTGEISAYVREAINAKTTENKKHYLEKALEAHEQVATELSGLNIEFPSNPPIGPAIGACNDIYAALNSALKNL